MSHPIQSIAMVGVGMVANVHLQSIVDLPSKIRLVGVLSRQAAHTQRFAAHASQVCGYTVKPYQELAELCADESIDWVIVLTPPNARADIISALANARKPVLLEKPIERNLAAAERIVQCCRAAGVPLGLVFQHRMREASIKLAALIKEKALGDLAIAEVKVPWWREQAYYDEPGRGTLERDGGGVLISQAIHSLDLMLSVTGPVSEVMAMAHTTQLHQMETEDYVSASLRFKCGAIGSLVASTANYPGDAESITLHFTKCVAYWQSGELNLHWRDGREESFGATATTGGGADPMAFTHTWHQSIIENFSDAVRNATPPLVTGREALAVHALIEALIDSSAKRRVVSVKQFLV